MIEVSKENFISHLISVGWSVEEATAEWQIIQDDEDD